MSRRPLLIALRALGLGDLLAAIPAFRALQRAWPHHQRVLATTSGVAALARHVELFDDVLEVAPLASLPDAPRPVDVAVNLHGRGPQSHRVLAALAPRRLVAFAHPEVPAGERLPEWRADEHEVARWCRLLESCGAPADPSELAVDPPRVPVPERAHGATLVHPGAANPARRWPPRRWAAVARAETVEGRTVLLTGDASERPLAHEVARRAGLAPGAVLAGRTSIVELAALVAAAGVVVCGDTGVAHLATALGTPSVVLFGPTSPAHWGPPPDRPRHRALWRGRAGDPHGGVTHDALLEIGVTDVVAQLAELRTQHAVVAIAGGEA